MNQFKWLSLIFLLILPCLVSVSHGQGGGGGDESMAESDQQDTGPEPADQNVVAPTNQQTKLDKYQKKETKPMKVVKSGTAPIGEQSILAMQQFAVLVGVALMVGILFMLNIGLDLLIDWISEAMTNLFCKKKIADDVEKAPAALVGTFKRYK
jgi:hypothetical protein